VPLSKADEEEIEKRIRKFVTDNLEKMNELRLEDIAINPYLIATMDLRTPEEIVEFTVTQRFQRGIVTAFGSLFEKKIAKYFGEAAGIADIDLKFERGGKTYFVQLKSGPEGFTGPALDKTLDTMASLKEKHPDAIPTIAFSYGARAKLSKVWGPRLLEAEKAGKVKVLVGREFWEFVLQDKNGYKVLFDIFKKARKVSAETIDGEIMTLEKARKDAYERILPEFKRKYGSGGDLVSKVLEDNL